MITQPYFQKFILPILFASTFIPQTALGCGVERWSVKTGIDADAGLVNLASTTSTTIAALTALAKPATLPANNRLQPTETTQFVISNVTLTQYKLETDQDIHLVIQDSAGNTMIAEIPDNSCMGAGSPFIPGVQNANSAFRARFTPTSSFQTANIPVTVTGVGFFDFLHGQTGVAPNGIELHSILSIVFNPGSGSFSLSGLTSLSVTQGSSASGTITSTVAGGFNSAVALSASGLPSGATASFNPAPLAAPGSGNSTLTISTTASTPTGTYTVTVTGSGGGSTATKSFSLTVNAAATPNYTLSASATQSVTQNSSSSGTVSTAVSGGFNSAISLSASGLPSGVTASFNPTSVAAPGSGSSTVTFSASASATTGTTPVTITGTGGGLTKTSTVSLTVSASGGGGGGTVNVISDGGFESATVSGNSAPGWTGTSKISGHNTITFQGTYPHTGTNYGFLGGANSESDTLTTQTYAIPANATAATLQFWVNVVTQETTATAYDFLSVNVLNASGTTLSTPLSLNNTNSSSSGNTNGTYFQPAAINLVSFAGQTIAIQFAATTDTSLPTTFRVDDVVLNVTTPTGGTPPTALITAPVNGATVSGTTTITASGSGAGITGMSILIDGAQVATGTSSALSYSWNTATAANGSHTVTATATNASGTGTSSAVTVTVSNGGGTSQLIQNPGFESGTTSAPWVANDSRIFDGGGAEPPHSGSWVAWLDGFGTATTNTLYQTVTIPSTAVSATLTFWLHIDTAETTTTTKYDNLTFQIQNSSGTVLATPQIWSNLNAAAGYKQYTFNLLTYKGQTIRIFFNGTEDGSSQTSFVLDDFALNVQ